ncbi:hypothetical protein L208DRAFT_1380987 [Tricholoma matsutake]|nr:hypothetical protein L208DRAFT_1380987 [Tricholoma matsutake 945]
MPKSSKSLPITTSSPLAKISISWLKCKQNNARNVTTYQSLPHPGQLQEVPYPLNMFGAPVAPNMLWKHAKSHVFDLPNCSHGISAHSLTISETSHSAWAGSMVAMCHYSTKDQQCGFWLLTILSKTKQYKLQNDDRYDIKCGFISKTADGAASSHWYSVMCHHEFAMIYNVFLGSSTTLPDKNVTPEPRCRPWCKPHALPPFAYAKDADSEFNEAVRRSLLEFTSSGHAPDASCPTIATAHQAKKNTNMSMSRVPMYHDVFEVGMQRHIDALLTGDGNSDSGPSSTQSSDLHIYSSFAATTLHQATSWVG